MIIDINKIKVNDRIRKDFGNIEELAKDIEENGLINPPTVTPEFELIAGERRLRACKHLGYFQIEVRVMSVKDEEHQLKMEISENENRKEFTFSERVDWAKRLERIERIKARERMGTRSNLTSDTVRSDDIVAEKSGFGSRDSFRKAKLIFDNADEELINQLDEKKISIHRAFTILKDKNNLHKQNNKHSLLYMIKHKGFDNFYKIGITDNLKQRIKSLNTASPLGVKVVHKVNVDTPNAIETIIHNKYIENKCNGEWFNFNNSEIDNVIEYINNLSKTVNGECLR